MYHFQSNIQYINTRQVNEYWEFGRFIHLNIFETFVYIPSEMASSRTTVRKPRKFYCNHCMINYPVFEEETPASVNTTTSGSSNRLFLLSCFHILCQTCRVQFGHNCPICHKKIQMMEINRRMPRHMQFYFEVMRKSIDQLLNISRFQNRQDKIVSDRRLGQRRKIKEVFANDIAENNGERITFKDSKDSYQKLFGIRQRCKEEKR